MKITPDLEVILKDLCAQQEASFATQIITPQMHRTITKGYENHREENDEILYEDLFVMHYQKYAEQLLEYDDFVKSKKEKYNFDKLTYDQQEMLILTIQKNYEIHTDTRNKYNTFKTLIENDQPLSQETYYNAIQLNQLFQEDFEEHEFNKWITPETIEEYNNHTKKNYSQYSKGIQNKIARQEHMKLLLYAYFEDEVRDNINQVGTIIYNYLRDSEVDFKLPNV